MQRGVASITPPGSPLPDIPFEFDSYDLLPQARNILKVNADWLRNNGAQMVEIEGHCDELGSTEYNLALGLKRAQAAKDYLVTLGIEGGRLSVISYGKEAPACMEHTEECQEKNRRSRFVIITFQSS
jgi:peptidoglycan-associated lipoprotein